MEKERLEAQLASLHEEMVAFIREEIKEGRASGQLLAVARNLVKDAHIEDNRSDAPVFSLKNEIPDEILESWETVNESKADDSSNDTPTT